MQNPTVSFVVPCYKLAHLLPECIESIVSQSYDDLEVLIMDDCSPDNTAEVARSFQDARVKHIRNESNLGALRNYNKGIGLSRGKYVWLISADDYLRRPYLLQRYVELMQRNPNVGYTFCPGIGVKNGQETGVLDYSTYGDHDRIVKGHTFLRKLLQSSFVLAPSVLARRECYEKLSLFPLDVVWADTSIDLIWGGDWYLWSLYALFYDVAYFAEPMVCYREHELSYTTIVNEKYIENCVLADIAVPWMIKQKADEAGFSSVSRNCLFAIAAEYSRHIVGKWYRSGTWTITLDQFEKSLCMNSQNEKVRNWIRARVYSEAGGRYYSRGDLSSAGKLYRASLQKDPWRAKVYAKMLLLSLRALGDRVRGSFGYRREHTLSDK